MEPNAVPGFTNRVIGRFVSRALISFPETAAYFRDGRTEITGLPVREEFFRIPPKPRGAVLNVLITGGSQGSRTLNQAARAELAAVPPRPAFQCGSCTRPGRPNSTSCASEFAESGLEGEVVPFITDMPAAFAAADLVVCRSGAGAVSELAAAGQAVDPGPVSVRGGRSPDAQRGSHGARRRGPPGARRRDERREAVFGDSGTGRAIRADWSAWRKRPGSFAKPGAAQRAADILEEVARG